MKIKYNARNVGAAALGCAMIAGTVCAGEETVSPSIASLTNMQEAAIPSTDTDWAFSFSAGWSSKYVTEGLYAGGDSANYDELDLVLGYAWNLGKWTVNPWYEHQFYFTQDYNVVNPALTVSYAVTDWMAVGAETQVKVEHQDFEAYYSAFVRLEWSPLENVTVVPMVRYGYNGGYNVDYDDGSNCIDWSLGVTWRFAEHYTLSGSVNYSQAATVLRHRDAGDEFWVGFRLGVEF